MMAAAEGEETNLRLNPSLFAQETGFFLFSFFFCPRLRRHNSPLFRNPENSELNREKRDTHTLSSYLENPLSPPHSKISFPG